MRRLRSFDRRRSRDGVHAQTQNLLGACGPRKDVRTLCTTFGGVVWEGSKAFSKGEFAFRCPEYPTFPRPYAQPTARLAIAT